jgi:hypothetical protein
MSTITIDRATLEQALEALDLAQCLLDKRSRHHSKIIEAYTAIKQTLKQPVQEPEIDGATMAGMDASIGHLSALVDELRLLLGCAMANAKMLHNAAKPDDGPDMDAIIPAIVFRNFVDQYAALRYAIRDSAHDGMLIPTQPAPAPVPLTDEQIDALRNQHPPSAGIDFDVRCRVFARAIEAAHGITKGQP